MPRAAERVAVDVCVRWGGEVLAVRRLQGTGEAWVGEVPGAMVAIPLDGLRGFAFAAVEQGAAEVLVPAGLSLRRTAASGEVEDVEGRARVALRLGDSALLRTGAFELSATAVEASRPRSRGVGVGKGRALGATLLVGLLHAGVLLACASEAFASPAEDDAAANLATMRHYLTDAEERTAASDPAIADGLGRGEGTEVNDRGGNGRAGGGARAKGREGVAGAVLGRAATPQRWGLLPSVRVADPAPPRAMARSSDPLGIAEALGSLTKPTPGIAHFGEGQAGGRDALAADGSLWARALGEAAGSEGLGLHGVGEGGGGEGRGVGLGAIGGLGHTDGAPGSGTGGKGAVLRAHALRSWTYRGRPYTCGLESCSVTGRMPAEAVQRVVRQHAGVLRGCYERGLFTNPTLAGRVSTKFLIDDTGAVASASNDGSDLPDPAVVACVVGAFRSMSFPAPDAFVTVVYPVTFTPTS
jgi:hypothetical protein